MMNYWSPLGTAAFWSVLGFLSVAAVLIWFSFLPYKREEPDQVSDALDALSDVSEETLRHIQAEYPFPYLSVVHYDTSNVPAHQIDTTVSLRAGRDYLFMGLLPDRPGLCMVADFRSGQIYIHDTKMFRRWSGEPRQQQEVIECMPSLEQKTEALKCVPSMVIEEIPPEIAAAPGVAHVQVCMSFLFGATSSRYYYSMEEAIDGSYSYLRITVYDVCRMIEIEKLVDDAKRRHY